MLRFLILIGACLLTAVPVSAQITFTLNNVSLGVTFGSGFTSAGSLSGTFTTSSNTLSNVSTLSSWNIVAPSSAAINGHAFAGFTYNPTDSTAHFNVGNDGLLTGFELDAPLNATTANAAEAVRFYFTTHLSANGPVSLSTPSMPPSSYENEQASGGNRWVTAGSVLGVPEPSSWLLACLAALGFGLFMRQRPGQA